ncbi:MAG: hypothetical protein IKW45_03770 [Clostridia bacterium]|nr:hypothetical protein [Clostridia bacterium]
MANDLKSLNDILFEQIEILNNTDVKDEKFESLRLRAETITNVSDRIIKNAELELKNQVWQSTRKFNCTSTKMIGVNE